MQGVAVKAVDALGLVRHHQCALSQRVLGRHPRGTFIGVTALRLNAANGEHETSRRIDPVSADGQYAGDIEGTDNLAARTDAHLVAQVQPHQRVVYEHQPFTHRHADVVAELTRCGAGAAFLAVDDDEVRNNTGHQHGLGDAHEFPGVAQAEFEAYRFTARQLAQLRNELQQLDRRAKGTVRCR
ncbi:hypothetical protein D3C81_1254480 [compost metagenome]